jgi:hypothetical protein
VDIDAKLLGDLIRCTKKLETAVGKLTPPAAVEQAAEKQNKVHVPIPVRSPQDSATFRVKMSFSAAC